MRCIAGNALRPCTLAARANRQSRLMGQSMEQGGPDGSYTAMCWRVPKEAEQALVTRTAARKMALASHSKHACTSVKRGDGPSPMDTAIHRGQRRARRTTASKVESTLICDM
ncbi:unnamed protein product [Clonostachys rosea f. rosea IK726]|uniref:Uncharacterized protein n=1 Tax=Clonostachys rosea f. rosea IK726 TaxID=1349383 RepID=A0ACA9TQE4_BIOOC|nr:unnamed protein product [Clonostachys rosea f. rosea IK726]